MSENGPYRTLRREGGHFAGPSRLRFAPRRRQPANSSVEELWEVMAEGEEPATRHPFQLALETARMWQERRGGDIYRKDVNDGAPVLFERKLL